MLDWLANWLRRRRATYGSIQADAKRLIARDQRNAYYEAQRLGARARAQGNAREVIRWARVAAEIARTSKAEMDYEKVKQAVDEELDHLR